MKPVTARTYCATHPTAGMQIGERLAWYKTQREATS